MGKQTIKQLFFVSPLQVDKDPNKILTVDRFDDEDAPQEMPRQDDFRGIPAQLKINSSGGFYIKSNHHIKLAFLDAASAKKYAASEAEKTPTIAYGVFACIGVYETVAPTVIEKRFNEKGELVLNHGEDKKSEVQG